MSRQDPAEQAAFHENGHLVDKATARVAILPVPFEGTVSYGGGTARGPAAILAASRQLELLDEQFRDEPHLHGIWTAPELDVHGATSAEVNHRVGSSFGGLMDDGHWVLMFGGEHSITPAAVAAAAERHPGLLVVQFDAHADLRESYEEQPDSHACAMARCLEHAPVRALGIRSYSPEEGRRIQEGRDDYRLLYAWDLDRPTELARVLDGIDGRPVYLSFDLDYFDPGIMPATGTPEPGGGQWWPTLALLEQIFRRADVIAADLVELAPARGLHHADFLAARLAYKLIGYATRT